MNGPICNVSGFGRAVRLFVGGTLMTWAVAGGPTWAWTGALVAATGAWRFCPVLWLVGIRSVR